MSRGRYFAYGSNLELARMTRRVPSARALGAARLADFEWVLDKRGSDGSAKANIRRAPGRHVWGVVYELHPAHWPELDACEGGYRRIEVAVELAGAAVPVLTYLSELRTGDCVAWSWYRQLMLDGARSHGLPEEWLAVLEAVRSHEEPGR